MKADSDDSVGVGIRAPSSFQHENNTVVADEMPDLDSTSSTHSSHSYISSSGSGSGSSNTDDSTDVPWYEKREEDATPPPPPPVGGDSSLEPTSFDESLPVISLSTQKSSFSGLTDTDNDSTRVSKLDLLHEEVGELKRKTMDGNDLSKEELMASLQRLDEIQNELNEGNHKSDHDEHDTNHDDKNSTIKRQGNRSSTKAFETPKTKRKQALGRDSAKAAARSAPTPKAKKKFQPTDRGAKSAPSPTMGRQRRKRGVPMAAHNISPPPSSRPSWNDTPVQNNRKKHSSPAKLKSEILDLKQRRSQKHLSQPEYATTSAPPPTFYTTSPLQPAAGRKSMRVPHADPTAATRRTYRAPRTTSPRASPPPVQQKQQQRPSPPPSWNHNCKRNYHSTSPRRYQSPGRMAATRLPKRPTSAPSMGRTKRRVSRGSKMSNAKNKPGGDSRPPMTPDLEAEEIPKKSLHRHTSNIDIPEVPTSPARKSNSKNRPKKSPKSSPSPRSSKRSMRTSFVYTDPSGRTIPLNQEQLKDLGLPPLGGEEEKKSKNRARSEEPSSAKEARVERAKKRREQMRGRSVEPDADIPKSIRTSSQQQRREESTRSKRTVSQSRNTRTTVPFDDDDNHDEVYIDNFPIGDPPHHEIPPLPPTMSSFQLRNKEYEYATPPRATVIGWNLVLIELVLDLVIAVIAFSAFSGSKRECCGESFQRGAIPWITTLLFFFLVLFEVVLLNRAIFVTLSPRSIKTTPTKTKDEEIQSSSDDSHTFSTASTDDPFTSIICCLSDWSPKFLMSVVNFMTILNPYFGFLIAWVLMYQAEKGYSVAVISFVAINIILHLLSLYMQKSANKKLWFKLVHGSILIPFLCTIIMAAWYVNQGGMCYHVGRESFSHKGCEICPNGSPAVNGNLCGETIFANGDYQTTYEPFDLGQLDQGSSCDDGRRACFIPY
jgi:hypothetical protein